MCKCKEFVFGIIGMNIFGVCMDILGDVCRDGNLSEVFVLSDLKQKFVCGFVRVFGIVLVCIFVNIVIVILCIGLYVKGDVIVNFLINGVYLYRNFCIVNICVNIYNGCMWVCVVNIGDEDIYFKLCSMICIVFFCDVEGDNLDIGFNCVGNIEEIFI